MTRRTSIRMDALFPKPGSDALICPECGNEHFLKYRHVRHALELIEEGCEECGHNLTWDDLGYREAAGCRVCHADVVDRRWNYCSDRCRRIAAAVQGMFTWTTVRKKILERDEYTCQKCGFTGEPRSGELDVDHITPIAKDGHPFDETNLQTLCTECHKEKTAKEAAERAGRSAERSEIPPTEYLDD